MRTLGFYANLFALAASAWTVLAAESLQPLDEASRPALVPQPQQIESLPGKWVLTRNTRLIAGSSELSEARKFADALAAPLGFRLSIADKSRPGDIIFALKDSRADLGDEGYELRVETKGAQLTARTAAGLFYAGQTLRQLLPEAAWRAAPVSGDLWRVPCVRILDRPRFAWRGLLLDPARYFIAKADLREIIDAMAMHKFNRLQLHLTDDQGWRVQLNGFPKLTARSAWREGTLLGHLDEQPQRISHVPHGGYYSQEDLRELVAYATGRHIVVIPEIEMPGHTGAWLAAYPEFAVFPERAAQLPVRTAWGINPNVLAPRPQTVEACRRILDELCEIFPSPWIHIGGDEAPRELWRESSEMQELIRKLGLRNEDELQAWFTAQLSHHLAAKNRRLVGWDEILLGTTLKGDGKSAKTTLATNAIAMAWRSWLGDENERAAARAGHDTIMAPADWTYLDHYQGPPNEEPLAIGESLSLARVYSYDPAPKQLPVNITRHVLGAQAQIWGEYISSFEGICYMMFPRACAMAEVCWSEPEAKDLDNFLQRLERHEARLRAMGLPFRPLARRTCLPDTSGQIFGTPADAMIHGTGITRQEDGTLGGWKSPATLLAWRMELRAPGTYRVRVLVKPGSMISSNWLEAVVGGRVLRGEPNSSQTSTDYMDLGQFRLEQSGTRLVFLRAGGTPTTNGFAVIRGLELAPAK